MESLDSIQEVENTIEPQTPSETQSPIQIVTNKASQFASRLNPQPNLVDGILHNVVKTFSTSSYNKIVRLLAKPQKNLQETVILSAYFHDYLFFTRYREIYEDVDEKEAFPYIFQQASVLHIKPNQPIYRENDLPNNKIYIIMTGEVVLIKKDPWMEIPSIETVKTLPEEAKEQTESTPTSNVYITDFGQVQQAQTLEEISELVHDNSKKAQFSAPTLAFSPVYSPIVPKLVKEATIQKPAAPDKNLKHQRTRGTSRQLQRPSKQGDQFQNFLPDRVQGVGITPLIKPKTANEKVFQPREFGNIYKTLHSHNYFGHWVLQGIENRQETAFATKPTTLLVLDAISFKVIPEMFSKLKKGVKEFIPVALPRWDHLSKKQYETIMSLIETQHYMAEDKLAREGEYGDVIYLIYEGVCEVTRTLIFDNSKQQKETLDGVDGLYHLKHTETRQVKVCSLTKGSFIGEETLLANYKSCYLSTVKVSSVKAVILKIQKSALIWRFPDEIREGILKLFQSKLESNTEILKSKLTLMNLSFNEDRLVRPGPIPVLANERVIYSPSSRPTSAKRPQSSQIFKLPLQKVQPDKEASPPKPQLSRRKSNRIGSQDATANILETDDVMELIDFLHEQSSVGQQIIQPSGSQTQRVQTEQGNTQNSRYEVMSNMLDSQLTGLTTDRILESTPPKKRPLKFRQVQVSSAKKSFNRQSTQSSNENGIIPMFDTEPEIKSKREVHVQMTRTDRTPENLRESTFQESPVQKQQTQHGRTVSLRLDGSPNVAKYGDYIDYASTNFDYISTYLKQRDELARHVQLFSFNLNDIQQDIQRRRKTEKNKKVWMKKRMEDIHRLGHAEEVAIPNRQQLSQILISKVMRHAEKYEKSLNRHKTCLNFLRISAPGPQYNLLTQTVSSPRMESSFLDSHVPIKLTGVYSSRPTTALPISRADMSRATSLKMGTLSMPASRPHTARVKQPDIIIPESAPSYPNSQLQKVPSTALLSTYESTVMTRTNTTSDLESMMIITNPLTKTRPMTSTVIPNKLGRRTKSSGIISKKVGGFAVHSKVPWKDREVTLGIRPESGKWKERPHNVQKILEKPPSN